MTAISKEPLRILQLNGREDDAELQRVQLHSAGLVFSSKRVETRRAFLAALDEFRPHLVLAEHRHAVFDGKAALQLIKERYPDIPVILVVDDPDTESTVEMLKLGASDIIFRNCMARLGLAVIHALADAEEYRQRRTVEQSLEESEQRFRRLIEESADIVGIVNPDGTIRYISPAVRELGGYEPQTLIGRSFLDFVHPEDLSKAKSTLATMVMRIGEAFRADLRFLHKDGSCLDTESILRNLVNVPGIDGIVVNLRDVTANKQAERSLRLFRELMDQVNDFIFVMEPHFMQIVDVNRTGCIRLGYTREEILAMTAPKLDPEMKLERWAIFNDVLSDTGSLVFESLIHAKNGSVIPVEFSLSRIKLEKAYLIATGRDLTERKRQEAEREASEAKYRSLFKATSEAIMTLVPPSWQFASGNPAAVKMFGAKDERDFNARPPWEWSPPLQPDGQTSARKAREMIEIALQTGSHAFEWIHQRANGQPFPADVLLTRVEQAGKVMLYATVRDITERHVSDAKLRLFRELIDHSNDAIEMVDVTTMRFLDCNRKACDELGYSREELLQKTVFDIDPGVTQEQLAALRAQLLKTPSAHFDSVHRRKDGSTFPVEISLKLVVLDRPYYVVSARDQTERKRAEAMQQARLSRLQAQYTSLATLSRSEALNGGQIELGVRELTQQASAVFGAERVNVWLYNDNATEMTCIDSYEATPATHTSGMVLREEEFRKEFAALKLSRFVDADDALNDPRTAGYVESYIRPLGIRSMLDVVIEGAGRRYGLLCIEHVNQTHHWEPDEITFACELADKIGFALANAAHLKLLANMRVSEETLRTVTSAMNDAVIMMDGAGAGVFWNPAAQRIFGYSRDEVMGRNLLEMLTPARDHEKLIQNMARFAGSGRGKFVGKTVEVPLLNKRGAEIPVELSVAAIEMHGQWHAVGIARDISERKKRMLEIMRINRTLRTLSAGNEALVRARDEEGLLVEMMRVLHEVGGYPIAWVGYAAGDLGKTVNVKASAGIQDADLMRLTTSWADNEKGRSVVGRAIRSGKMQRINNDEPGPAGEAWRNLMQAYKARALIGLPLSLTPHSQPIGAIGIAASETDAFGPDELKLLKELAEDLGYGIANLRIAAERRAMTDKLRVSLEGTIAAVGATMEMRDPYTAGHQRRVAVLAAAIAGEMGLPKEIIEGVRLGALIHDVGKIQLPSEILTKPGVLSKLEYEMIKTHPQIGYDIVKDIEFPWPVALMVLQHHERFDGSGYPQGLKGKKIIPEARILAVADVVEAMSSHRPYRPSRGIEQALTEIETHRGSLYEPEAVDACLRLFREKHFSLESI